MIVSALAPEDLTLTSPSAASSAVQTAQASQWASGKRVLRVWTAQLPRASWAYLEDVGWRRVPRVSADGRRDLLEVCCHARTEGLTVTALVTADDILRLRY